MLKSDGQISPFCMDRSDVAKTFLMLHEAVGLFPKMWLQPPHWNGEPTPEMLAEENGLEQESEDAKKEITRLAGEIYKSLTGKTVLTDIVQVSRLMEKNDEPR